jgi:hypothetical protein
MKLECEQLFDPSNLNAGIHNDCVAMAGFLVLSFVPRLLLQ